MVAETDSLTDDSGGCASGGAALHCSLLGGLVRRSRSHSHVLDQYSIDVLLGRWPFEFAS